MADRAKHTAISVIMLRLGRSRLRIRGGHHFRTDRRHIEGIGYGVSDNTKCRDRRKQLHQYREQHDWNKDFQPPSHDLPQNALGVLPLASPLVEITWGVATVHARIPKFYPNEQPRAKGFSTIRQGRRYIRFQVRCLLWGQAV